MIINLIYNKILLLLCIGMTGNALLVATLLVVAVAGTNHSLNSDGVCVEAVLRRVNITADKLPVALLATTRRLTESDLPWLDTETVPSWEWDSWARELLDTDPDIQVTSNSILSIPFVYEPGSSL